MKLAIPASAALAALFLLPGLMNGPSLDAAVFTEVARHVADGALPYSGAWDHKPPGLYLLGGAAQEAFRWVDPWTVMWGLGLLAVVGAAACVALTLRRVGHPEVAWVGALLATAVATNFVIALGGGLTEPMACLPLAAALLVAVSGRQSWTRATFVGALLGLALLTSLITAPGVAAIALFSAFRGPRPPFLMRLGTLVLGMAAPLAVVLGALALLGAGRDALDALLAYGAAYRAVNLGFVRANEHASAAAATLSIVAVGIPALIGLLRALRLSSPWPSLAGIAILWVAGTVALAVYLGRFETHYAAPLAIPLGIFAAIGLGDVARRARRSYAEAAVLIAVLAIGLFISTAVTLANVGEHGGSIAAENQRDAAVSRYLHDHAPAGATLLVWGNEPQIYYLANRSPATRFVYLLPLTTPGYATSAMVDAVRAHLEANPPALIVDVGSLEPGSAGDPPLLIDRPLRNEDGRDLDILDPLRDFVRQRYSLLEVVDGWPVYRLSSLSTPTS